MRPPFFVRSPKKLLAAGLDLLRSRDDSVEAIRGQFPAVRVVALGQNDGYGDAARRICHERAPLRSHMRPEIFDLPAWANTALTGVLALEGAVLRRANLPVGVSLLCLARKP